MQKVQKTRGRGGREWPEDMDNTSPEDIIKRTPKPDPKLRWLWFHRQIFHLGLSANALFAYLGLCCCSYRPDGIKIRTKVWKVLNVSRRTFKRGLRELIARGLVRETDTKYILLAVGSEDLPRFTKMGRWGWIYRADFKRMCNYRDPAAAIVYALIAAHVLPNQVCILGAEQLQKISPFSRPKFYQTLRNLELVGWIKRKKCGRRVQIVLKSMLWTLTVMMREWEKQQQAEMENVCSEVVSSEVVSIDVTSSFHDLEKATADMDVADGGGVDTEVCTETRTETCIKNGTGLYSSNIENKEQKEKIKDLSKRIREWRDFAHISGQNVDISEPDFAYTSGFG